MKYLYKPIYFRLKNTEKKQNTSGRYFNKKKNSMEIKE